MNSIGKRRAGRYILAAIIIVCLIPMSCPDEQVHAKSRKPGKVRGIHIYVAGSTAKIRWNPAKRAKSYVVKLKICKGKNWRHVKTIKVRKNACMLKIRSGHRYLLQVRGVRRKKGKWTKHQFRIAKSGGNKTETVTGQQKPSRNPSGTKPSSDNQVLKPDAPRSTGKPETGGDKPNTAGNAEKYSYTLSLMNLYPIYAGRRYDGNASIYIDTANPEITMRDITARNLTTGKGAIVKQRPKASAAVSADTEHRPWKDVLYSDAEKGQLTRGGLLIDVNMTEAEVGENRIALFAGNYELGTVNVQVKDYDEAYQAYIVRSVETAISEKYGGERAKPTTPNADLLNQLYYVEKYLKSITTYKEFEVRSYLQGAGLPFETGYTACEAAAADLMHMFGYLGVSAHTEYIDNGGGGIHMVVYLDDPESYGWKSPKKFDACPSPTGNTSPPWGYIL